MKLSSRAHDLYEAFSRPGCPVCRLTLDSVHHHLDSLIYEYVNKPATHEAVRAARGFCPAHAWHVQDAINASALGNRGAVRGGDSALAGDMGTGRAGRRAAADQPGGEVRSSRAGRARPASTSARRGAPAAQPVGAYGRGGVRSGVRGVGRAVPAPPAADVGAERHAEHKAQALAIQQAIWARSRRSSQNQCASTTTASPPIGKGEEGSSPRRANRGARRAEGLR